MSADPKLDAIWKAIKAIQRRLTFAVGVPPAVHAPNHSSGSTDPIDILDLDGYPNTSPADSFLREDGTWAVPAGTGDVAGPGSSTDNAFARFDGTTGKLLQDSTGASLDDAGRAIFKAIRMPLFDAGNSGTSKTIDWDDGNEQLLTLTGNVTLTLSNPGDGGRYVLKLKQDGSGGYTVTWPGTVYWAGTGTTAPTITATASHWDIVTLLYDANDTSYTASINQDFG